LVLVIKNVMVNTYYFEKDCHKKWSNGYFSETKNQK